jgi:hypothetical protein
MPNRALTQPRCAVVCWHNHHASSCFIPNSSTRPSRYASSPRHAHASPSGHRPPRTFPTTASGRDHRRKSPGPGFPAPGHDMIDSAGILDANLASHRGASCAAPATSSSRIHVSGTDPDYLKATFGAGYPWGRGCAQSPEIERSR